MKGSREFKNYVKRYSKQLKMCYWDDLNILTKYPNDKKWRKTKRRPRDGYGEKGVEE
jgi:hypothetical protein